MKNLWVTPAPKYTQSSAVLMTVQVLDCCQNSKALKFTDSDDKLTKIYGRKWAKPSNNRVQRPPTPVMLVLGLEVQVLGLVNRCIRSAL